jgi:uncharacterized protein involved in cysteine biosynthesis
MLTAFALAFADLRLPAMRRALLLALGGSVLLFLALLGGLGWLLANSSITGIGWLETLADVLGGAAALVAAWLLFPAATLALLPLLLDPVAAAIEARHYPHLPPARPASAASQAWAGLRLAGLATVLNLLALPLVLFVPGLGLLAFLLVNGWLLGREYFELAALRRVGNAEAKTARRANAGRTFAGGLALAAMGLVPFGNLLVPLLGAAAFVHMFHRRAVLAARHAGV